MSDSTRSPRRSTGSTPSSCPLAPGPWPPPARCTSSTDALARRVPRHPSQRAGPPPWTWTSWWS